MIIFSRIFPFLTTMRSYKNELNKRYETVMSDIQLLTEGVDSISDFLVSIKARVDFSNARMNQATLCSNPGLGTDTALLSQEFRVYMLVTVRGLDAQPLLNGSLGEVLGVQD